MAKKTDTEGFSDRLRRAEEMLRASRKKMQDKQDIKKSQTELTLSKEDVQEAERHASRAYNDMVRDTIEDALLFPETISEQPQEGKEATESNDTPPILPQTTQSVALAEVTQESPQITSYEPQSIELVPEPSQAAPLQRGRLIEDNLSQTVETDSSIKTVAKELFNRTNIDLKTEVTHDEINQITKLRFLQVKFGVSNVDVLIHSLLGLRVSKNRKSRGEFVNIVQTENRNQQSGGLGSKLAAAFGGGNNNPWEKQPRKKQ